MKKTVLPAIFTLFISAATAQIVNDSVAIGSGNEIWYRLADGNKITQPRNNWDLALETNSFGITILFNNIGGNAIYEIPGTSAADFATADTSGLSTWAQLYNSDTSWAQGALNSASATYGWGEYNMITHSVEGSVVFVIKYTNGTYKKFLIEKVDNTIPGNYFYSIIHANLDNTAQDTAIVVKQTYNSKNFVYYSIQNDQILDREPPSNDWDLLFSKYYGLVSGQMYPLTGTLHNKGVTVSQADGIADPANYTDYSSHSFETEINTIGSDWKSFNGTAYVIASNRVYFVKAKDNHIYKMIFTGYTGGSISQSAFTKEDLGAAVGIHTFDNSAVSFAVYPNPSSGSEVTLLISSEHPLENTSITIKDLQGRQINVIQPALLSSGQMHQLNVATNNLASGIYYVQLSSNNTTLIQKLIINK